MVTCIFARGGSKGLPNKNIRSFAGKPLIAWSIESALQIPSIREVFVSTDSIEIGEVARSFGAVVPFLRPADLAQDDSPEILAWRHMLHYFKEKNGAFPDVMLSVPTTSPLRAVEDIQKCLDEFEPGITDAVVTVTEAHRNPYFNMVTTDENNFSRIVLGDSGASSRRQDAPKVFDLTTVAYVVDVKFIIEHNSLFEGRVKAVHVPVERSIDIDSLHDFDVAEFLMNQRSKHDS